MTKCFFVSSLMNTCVTDGIASQGSEQAILEDESVELWLGILAFLKITRTKMQELAQTGLPSLSGLMTKPLMDDKAWCDKIYEVGGIAFYSLVNSLRRSNPPFSFLCDWSQMSCLDCRGGERWQRKRWIWTKQVFIQDMIGDESVVYPSTVDYLQAE